MSRSDTAIATDDSVAAVCIVCQAAPGLMAGGSGIGLAVYRLRLLVGARVRVDDREAWADQAAGRGPMMASPQQEPRAS